MAYPLSDAELFFRFLLFLRDKPDDFVFNVPRGKIDKIDRNKVKFFLDLKGQNKVTVWDPLEQRGWRALPFFVIDPFDRATFPTIESKITENSDELKLFTGLITQTLK